jgi:hypothetical protein
MPKKINYVPNISNIKLSLILIVMICAIVFFVYLRKEQFKNNSNSNVNKANDSNGNEGNGNEGNGNGNYQDPMLEMTPNDIRDKLERVKKCIQNPDACDSKEREDIIKDITQLSSLV